MQVPGPRSSLSRKVFQTKIKDSKKKAKMPPQQQVLNQKLMKLAKKVSLIKSFLTSNSVWKSLKNIFFYSIVAIKGKMSSAAKKGSIAKGVEHDAMGIKWNKSMWDNMESKFSLL